MDYSTNSNVIIGSKLALAMSMVVGSPVRQPIGTPSSRRRGEFAKMDRRCEALKNRSLRLLEEMEDGNSRIAFDAASMRSPAARETIKRIGKVMGKMMEQQVSLHSQMEKLLDSMMLEIRSDRDSNS